MLLSDFIETCEDLMDEYGDIEVLINVVAEKENEIKSTYYNDAVFVVNDSETVEPHCFLRIGDGIDEI